MNFIGRGIKFVLNTQVYPLKLWIKLGVNLMNFYAETFGFRNNNPGNIRTNCAWNGLTERGDNKGFCEFISIEFGIRAIYKTLLTYRDKHNLTTIHGIVHRWAPEIENNTASYITSVVQYINRCGNKTVTSVSDVWELNIIELLIMGIIHHENGLQPFNEEFIRRCMCMEQ